MKHLSENKLIQLVKVKVIYLQGGNMGYLIKGTVQQLNFGLFEIFFFDLIYLSSSGEHISFWYIPCFGPPNKSYSRVKGRILCWKHNQPKFKSFLTLQPHWKHSGQQNFFSDLLVIIEIRHVFFNMHLFQFIEML